MSHERNIQHEQDANVESLAQAAFAANLASMQVIRSFQLGGQVLEHQLKADNTLLTSADLASERAAKTVLKQAHGNVQILGEEYGLDGDAASEHLFMIDPLDGTRPFSAGAPTSTTISAVYSKEARKLEATVIGEPATGRVWYTADGQTMRLRMNTETGDLLQEPEVCRVWDGAMAPSTTVLIDNFQGFARDKGTRQILTNAGVLNLFGTLQPKTAVQNYGSNGLHHALVANGGEKVVGAITTAMGGEFDVAGALLVKNAGGVALGLRINADRSISDADPLDPFSYDILVAANNQSNLDELTNAVRQSVSL